MEENDKVTVWITKYALTRGVFMVPARIIGGKVIVKLPPPLFICRIYGDGLDWHRTRESAIARVQNMKTIREKSLRKSLAALENPIEVPE